MFVDMHRSVCKYAPECVVTKHRPDPGLDLGFRGGETEPKRHDVDEHPGQASGCGWEPDRVIVATDRKKLCHYKEMNVQRFAHAV
jgi:hypothetical protein